MWLIFAFISAGLLGFYDVFKKQSLRNNAVLPVLLINTLLCSIIFIPFIFLSATGTISDSHDFYIPNGDAISHFYILIKSLIVLSSWVCGYYAIKNLPLTIVGPINATRPVLTLIGALLIFGERLNSWQWIGVLLAIISFFLLSRNGKKEGISFTHNRWIYLLMLAALLGAASGLYDKHLMSPCSEGGLGLDRLFVQSWYNIYQAILMGAVILLIWYPRRHVGDSFRWKWSIPCISIFITIADLSYFYALSQPGAMIAVVSMIRRSSVLVSFIVGGIMFKEQHLGSKAIDLLLVFLSMVFLYIGTAT